MGEVANASEVRSERDGGPVRRGCLPAESEPVMYGAHDGKRDAAQRALATHHRACPVSRSIEAGVEITTGWA